jgi:hypothetical protein
MKSSSCFLSVAFADTHIGRQRDGGEPHRARVQELLAFAASGLLEHNLAILVHCFMITEAVVMVRGITLTGCGVARTSRSRRLSSPAVGSRSTSSGPGSRTSRGDSGAQMASQCNASKISAILHAHVVTFKSDFPSEYLLSKTMNLFGLFQIHAVIFVCNSLLLKRLEILFAWLAQDSDS